MDSVIRSGIGLFNAILREVSQFDEVTWCVLAVASITFGYFMLKGNAIRPV